MLPMHVISHLSIYLSVYLCIRTRDSQHISMVCWIFCAVAAVQALMHIAASFKARCCCCSPSPSRIQQGAAGQQHEEARQGSVGLGHGEAESEQHGRQVSHDEAEVGQHDTGVRQGTAEARHGEAGFNQPDSTAVVEVLSDIKVSMH